MAFRKASVSVALDIGGGGAARVRTAAAKSSEPVRDHWSGAVCWANSAAASFTSVTAALKSWAVGTSVGTGGIEQKVGKGCGFLASATRSGGNGGGAAQASAASAQAGPRSVHMPTAKAANGPLVIEKSHAKGFISAKVIGHHGIKRKGEQLAVRAAALLVPGRRA